MTNRKKKTNNLSLSSQNLSMTDDDIQKMNDKVFDAYIKTSKATGLKHLNFGLHGNHNRDSYGNPTIIKTVNYGNGISIDLYPNVLGAFSYYHRSVLDDVGLMPTYYFDALEAVETIITPEEISYFETIKQQYVTKK